MLQEEPKDYLNVETPFKRTSSLSVHDKRITKSTTNLADMDFGWYWPVCSSKNHLCRRSIVLIQVCF